MKIGNIEGNEIIGSPSEVGVSAVVFQGKGNKLVIGEKVRFTDVRIRFVGSNGTLIIGDGAVIRGMFGVYENCTITIGEGSRFNKPVALITGEGRSITIGKGCLFADVRFRTTDFHSVIDRKTGKRLNAAKDIVVGDRVWIAEECRVYKGVTIGEGSIIGAGSLVLKDVPAYSLAAGVPAKVRRKEITWDAKLLATDEDELDLPLGK